MDEAEFEKAVVEERLGRWLARSRPGGTTANKVCVFEDYGAWRTLVTDERAGVLEGTRREFATESEALADALDSLRLLKDLLTFRA
ncbi:hypothetical protein AB1K54_16060 [Microbacterium sp. BWT-B31]|uniref:hypothetical protein n=1 Tax=Microbacterium sp. BWT-B31 TaxID=3232072 RepID=UPI0035293511